MVADGVTHHRDTGAAANASITSRQITTVISELGEVCTGRMGGMDLEEEDGEGTRKNGRTI